MSNNINLEILLHLKRISQQKYYLDFYLEKYLFEMNLIRKSNTVFELMHNGIYSLTLKGWFYYYKYAENLNYE